MKRVKIGIIGCGNISDIYLANCTSRFSDILEVEAIADLITERAVQQAKKYNIPKAYTATQMLADPQIELIVNLTIPQSHASVNLMSIEAGKSVYVEKPFALTREDGLKTIKAAKRKGAYCAAERPTPFWAPGIQICRKLIDDGIIGKPIGAAAFMMCTDTSHGISRLIFIIKREGDRCSTWDLIT